MNAVKLLQKKMITANMNIFEMAAAMHYSLYSTSPPKSIRADVLFDLIIIENKKRNILKKHCS